MPIEKHTLYAELFQQANALIAGETDIIANMANVSALLFQSMPDINWAGFYRVIDNVLVLGPFQGKPACIRIPVGVGVSGAAMSQKTAQIVEDVHQFDGHIACDVASNSEIVVPIIYNGEVVAVLDIDSPVYNRFDQEDLDGLMPIIKLMENCYQ